VAAAAGSPAAAALGYPLFADGTAQLGALRLSLVQETLAFARTHAFARMVFGLAVVLAFTGVDAIAMNLGIGSLHLGGDTGKHASSSDSESGTSGGGFDVHFYFLMIGSGVG
jgi:hypothetical protein